MELVEREKGKKGVGWGLFKDAADINIVETCHSQELFT